MATKTAGKQRTRKQDSDNAGIARVKDKSKGMQLHGNVIFLGSHSKTGAVKHKDVVQALKDASLDEKVAREFTSRQAWTRAVNKLKEERVIEVWKEDNDTATFQFTKSEKAKDELKYKKETFVTLFKATGKIECEIENLRTSAQTWLDKCMEDRTTNDVTQICMRLFSKEAEIMSIPGAIGAYFVPIAYKGFTDKIEDFLQKLGRKPYLIPIPEGTERGDKMVADVIETNLADMISSLQEEVGKFDIHTRSDTLASRADTIKEIKGKITSYAVYLGGAAKELERVLEEADEALVKKISVLTEEKKNAPQNVRGSGAIFGYSASAAGNWMGKEGWGYKDAKKVMEHFKVTCSDVSIRTALSDGRGGKYGKPAAFTKEEVKELEKVRKS